MKYLKLQPFVYSFSFIVNEKALGLITTTADAYVIECCKNTGAESGNDYYSLDLQLMPNTDRPN